jgi:hypothetical protein
MNRKGLLFLWMFLLGFRAFCQYEEEIDTTARIKNKYCLGIGGGFGNVAVRDRVISTFLYSGDIVPLSFHFDVRTESKKSFLRLEFMNSPILHTKTNEGFAYKGQLGEFFPTETDGLDLSTLKSKAYLLNYTILYLLKDTENRKINVFLGFDLSHNRFQKNFIQFEYKNKLNDLIQSASVVLSFERNFNFKHQLEYIVSTPIISRASRTLTNLEADPTTVTQVKYSIVKNIFGFDSRLHYRFHLSQKVSLKGTYAFRYLQVNFPEKEQWAYSQGFIGLYFHF